MKESSLYIHIPYCMSKCIYCDFYSGGASCADWVRLKDSFLNELSSRKDELQSIPDTLYVGGGTPSLMPQDIFLELIDSACNIINPSRIWTEFTIEVNPDDVTEEKCKSWKNAGVNRVSIGIQSLNDSELKAIRRRHDSRQGINAYQILRKYFSNISIDLMFGIPGQTLESWRDTVSKVISLNPRHLSAYSLMLEEGTALTTLYNQGKVELPEEETIDEMWRYLSDELKRYGYEQYEISNYCIPGCRSKHNSRYWSANPYLGLGPSAHSFDGNNIRRFNPSDLKGYLSFFTSPVHEEGKSSVFYVEERLSEYERIEERILTRMRTKEGIDLVEFKKEFGEQHCQRLLENAAPLVSSGEVTIDSDHLSLTHSGIMMSNRIILALSM